MARWSSTIWAAIWAALAGLLVVACGSPGDDSAPTVPDRPAETLTLLTHDSFAQGATEETFAPFTADTGVSVEIVTGGDAGAMVNQAILTKDNPVADVLFGVDDTFLSRALDEQIFLPHRSPLLEAVPAELQLDPEHRVTPIDFGDVCLNYDVAAFSPELPPPAGLTELADPRYAGMLVVENPATSSPGLAFLLATIARFGEEGWQDYWRDLVANDLKVVAGWDEAYYGDFSGGAGSGDRPLVVSYASSPPAEVIFSDPRPAEAPTAVITDGCYRQVEFAGILAGTEHRTDAARLVDFLLTREFQETIPLSWFVFPANSEASLPSEFIEFTARPVDPVTMDPDRIAEGREGWIREWTEIVLP